MEEHLAIITEEGKILCFFIVVPKNTESKQTVSCSKVLLLHFVKNLWRIINTIAWDYLCAQIFVLKHYLSPETHSFPRTSLSENWSHLGTGNVCRQYLCIFTPRRGYCLFNIKLHVWVICLLSPWQSTEI